MNISFPRRETVKVLEIHVIPLSTQGQALRRQESIQIQQLMDSCLRRNDGLLCTMFYVLVLRHSLCAGMTKYFFRCFMYWYYDTVNQMTLPPLILSQPQGMGIRIKAKTRQAQPSKTR